MVDQRYSFEKTIAAKVIVEGDDGSILLVKEPDFNEWMPGHWGLPGGKLLRMESINELVGRKMRADLGRGEMEGRLYRIEELLFRDRTVLMFIFLMKTEVFVPKGEIAEYRWVNKSDVEKMDVSLFTEFYNKKLLIDFFDGDSGAKIESWRYFELEKDVEFVRWLESGRKK